VNDNLDKSRNRAVLAIEYVTSGMVTVNALATADALKGVAFAILYLGDCIRTAQQSAQPAPAPQQGRAAGAEEEER